MKKQISLIIKARRIRSAYYVLLLVGLCLIPFALAQRNTTRRSAATPATVKPILAYAAFGGPKAVSPFTGAVRAAGDYAIDTSRLPYDSRPYRPLSTRGGVCTPEPWQATSDMPTDLYGATGASDGTFFYAAGGYSFSSGNTLAVFNRYDPVANTWTPLPDMPQSASLATAVYYPPTNKLYVFGGEDAVSGTNYNITRIYDIASNTWTTGANMLDVHSLAAGGYVPDTGKIYILSGYNTGTVDSAQPTTWQYDPATDTWTDLTGSAPYPHPAGGFAYGVINGKIYTAGGRDAANEVINDTWEYDPLANTYTQKADEPGTFQNNVPGSTAAQGLLWVFGGGSPFVGDSANKIASNPVKAAFPCAWLGGGKAPGRPVTANSGRSYNPVTDTWTSSPDMIVPRSFPSGGAIGEDLIVAAGGYDGTTTLAGAETEVVCAGGPTPTPTATPSCTPIVVNGDIASSDPTQTDRLFRDGIPSTCAAPKTCPGPFADEQQHHYDSYSFSNTSGSTQCVSVDASTNCVGANSIFLAAYLGNFDPTDLCANYLADQGTSPDPTDPPGPFSFDLGNGQTVVIVVAEVTADAGCPGYTMSVSGLCAGGITPTPTITVTPTATPSATPGHRPTPRPRPTPHPRPTP